MRELICVDGVMWSLYVLCDCPLIRYADFFLIYSGLVCVVLI